MSSESVTVFVVDDDDAVRDSLTRLFASVGMRARAFPSGETFMEFFENSMRGCLVLGLRMPGMSAFEVQDALAKRGSDLPIIFITGYGDVETGVRAMKAGAVDLIEKPFKEQALLETVQRAIAQYREKWRKGAAIREIRKDFDRLTPREREVLEHIIAGEPDKRIAHILDLSEKTVEFHRANIMRKTEAKSLADLIQKALRIGAVERGRTG